MSRFSFRIEEDEVEFYDPYFLVSMTPQEMIEFQQVLKEAMFEWCKTTGRKLDEGKPK